MNNVLSNCNNPLMNTIEINAILNLLKSKGLIDIDEYKQTLVQVSDDLLHDAERKGLIDKRVRHEIICSIYNNL